MCCSMCALNSASAIASSGESSATQSTSIPTPNRAAAARVTPRPTPALRQSARSPTAYHTAGSASSSTSVVEPPQCDHTSCGPGTWPGCAIATRGTSHPARAAPPSIAPRLTARTARAR
jgi:hypothetical protein